MKHLRKRSMSKGSGDVIDRDMKDMGVHTEKVDVVAKTEESDNAHSYHPVSNVQLVGHLTNCSFDTAYSENDEKMQFVMALLNIAQSANGTDLVPYIARNSILQHSSGDEDSAGKLQPVNFEQDSIHVTSSAINKSDNSGSVGIIEGKTVINETLEDDNILEIL